MLRIALVGFGTVGRSVARILCQERRQDLVLTQICNRQVERKKVDWIPEEVVWTSNFGDVLRSDADVVVEVIGGNEPATGWIRQALEAGKSVVTANKQVMAQTGTELLDTAAANRRHLLFEAAVAGAIPIIRGLREGLAGDRLTRVLGLLNGTCNYVLTRMEAAEVSFDEALKEAQDRGYAEADPAADIDGSDAQAKLAILSAVGLGRQVAADTIPLRSIRPVNPVDFLYARRLGFTIRQVSRAELLDGPDRRVSASVQPMLVPFSSRLAHTQGCRNVVVVEGMYGGETAFSGFGAGGDPTAVAIVSDLEAIARGNAVLPAPAVLKSSQVESDFAAPQYVRFIVTDRPGIIASLAAVFSSHGMNVDSVLQEPGWPKSELPFVVTLETCRYRTMRAALTEIEKFDFHARQPVWMPILATAEAG